MILLIMAGCARLARAPEAVGEDDGGAAFVQHRGSARLGAPSTGLLVLFCSRAGEERVR